jgi:hypothetical protein
MNDASKYPSRDLVLKLHWLPDDGVAAGGHCPVVELQFVDGLTLASISVSSVQLLQAITQKLGHYPLISPDGFVSIASDEVVEVLPKGNTISLDQLVAEAISPDMLDDEPNAAPMLAELHARLLKSLELVDQAIASLPKA